MRLRLAELAWRVHCTLFSAPLPLLLCTGRALGRGLEHRPLHRDDALLEARGARPRERGRLGERRRHLCLAEARVRVVVDRRAEVAREQPLAALLRLLLAALALARWAWSDW